MYRVFFRVALTGFTLGLLSLFAAGPQSAGAAQVALQAVPTANEAAANEHFGQLIDQRLGVVPIDETQRDKAWRAQLKSFYAARGGAPVWVSAKGWTARAQTALAELANAGNWGLDASAFPLPQLAGGTAADDDLVSAEIALSQTIVKYAHHARGGRIDPSSLSLWLDRTPNDVYATAVMIDIISHSDAGAVLRDMHPRSEAFELLRQAYVATRHEIQHPKTIDPAEILAPGKAIKVNEWHPDVLIVRKRLNAPALAGFESKFDEKLANVLDDALSEARVRVRWGTIDNVARAFFNRPPPAPTTNDLMRIQANMERWRWLPDELGAPMSGTTCPSSRRAS